MYLSVFKIMHILSLWPNVKSIQFIFYLMKITKVTGHEINWAENVAG